MMPNVTFPLNLTTNFTSGKVLFLLQLMKQCYNETDIKHSSYDTVNDSLDPHAPRCPVIFDGYLCWDKTPAATTAYRNCPDFVVGFDPKRFTYKRCTENGTWFNLHPEAKIPWTNYTTCIDVDDLSFRSLVNEIYVYGYSVSLLALVASIGVFIYYRALQCTRIKIHMHLFSAFAVNNILWIIWYKAVVNNPEVVQNNEIWCQALHIMTHYFMVTSYLWMFIEALHLHVSLVVVFVKEELAMKCFIAIGWAVSAIIVIIYSIVRYNVYDDVERCWMDQSNSFWIIVAPVVVSLFASFFFLVNVVCVLLTKLYPTANQGTTLAIRKATRAALLLIPLFGLHFTLIPLRPSPNSAFEKVYQIFSALLTSLQGLALAILFCFTNHDVKAATRGHFSRARRVNRDIPMTGLTGGDSLGNTRDNVA